MCIESQSKKLNNILADEQEHIKQLNVVADFTTAVNTVKVFAEFDTTFNTSNTDTGSNTEITNVTAFVLKVCCGGLIGLRRLLLSFYSFFCLVFVSIVHGFRGWCRRLVIFFDCHGCGSTDVEK